MAAPRPRPRVEAALFNPAFVGLILLTAARAYRTVAKKDMPFELAYLVPALVLHEETRHSLPKATSARLSGWVGTHPVIAAEYPGRAATFVPTAHEALTYVAAGGSARLQDGRLAPARKRRAPVFSADGSAVLAAAELVGRWFARSGPPSTIYALLGVRP